MIIIMKPILEIAKAIDLLPDDMELFGQYISKITPSGLERRFALKKGKLNNPYRIVVDSELKIPMDSNILKSNLKSKVVIATTARSDAKKVNALKEKGANVVVVENDNQRVNLFKLMDELGKMEITSVMIEGGSELNSSALESGIVDKVIFFIAPRIIGGKDSMPAVGGRCVEKLSDSLNIHDVNVDRCGSDIVIEGYLK